MRRQERLQIMNLVSLFAIATLVALVAVYGQAAFEQGLNYPQTAFASAAGR